MEVTATSAKRKLGALNAYDLLSHVGGVLGDKVQAQELIKASENIVDYVRRVAKEMKNRDGTENEIALSILGMISDIALKRMTPIERKHLSLDTPIAILTWFAGYIENTMDKKDLVWSTDSKPKTREF